MIWLELNAGLILSKPPPPKNNNNNNNNNNNKTCKIAMNINVVHVGRKKLSCDAMMPLLSCCSSRCGKMWQGPGGGRETAV